MYEKEYCRQVAYWNNAGQNGDCCAEEANKVHDERREHCDALDDAAEREECHAQVKESLEQALETCQPPEPTCWEEAMANYN